MGHPFVQKLGHVHSFSVTDYSLFPRLPVKAKLSPSTMSDTEENTTLPTGLYTEKPKVKKSKSKAKQPEKMDLGAVPPHILRIVQGLEEKRKSKKDEEKKRQQKLIQMETIRKPRSNKSKNELKLRLTLC